MAMISIRPTIAGEPNTTVVAIAKLPGVPVVKGIFVGTVDIKRLVEVLVTSPCHQQVVPRIVRGEQPFPTEINILQCGPLPEFCWWNFRRKFLAF